MVYLLNTNVIIRFLVGDHEEHLAKSIEFFKQIESMKLQALILEGVLMEAFFVLTKFYKLPKEEVINDLKTILALNGVVNANKPILFETLNLLENKNIDFVDAMLCAKSKLEGFGRLSFNDDVKRC